MVNCHRLTKLATASSPSPVHSKRRFAVDVKSPPSEGQAGNDEACLTMHHQPARIFPVSLPNSIGNGKPRFGFKLSGRRDAAQPCAVGNSI